MKNSEKIVLWIKIFIILALFVGCVVVDAIQCVADTRKNIEIIKSGKVPVEVSSEK